MPGTDNDFNVLNASPPFQDILKNAFSFWISGTYKVVQEFGVKRKVPYFLVDGIYLRWDIFTGPVSEPTVDQQYHKNLQESIRKDVESLRAVNLTLTDSEVGDQLLEA